MAIATGTAIVTAAGLATAGSAYANWQRRKEASRNRAFQERMSSTATQRQVKDLIKAGINPILAAKYGGSSTPPGAVAQQENIGAQAPEAASAFSTLQLQKKLQSKQIDKLGSDIGVNSALELKHDADALLATNKANVIKPIATVGKEVGTAAGKIINFAKQKGITLIDAIKSNLDFNKKERTKLYNYLKKQGYKLNEKLKQSNKQLNLKRDKKRRSRHRR